MTKPTIAVDGARDLRRALKAVEGGVDDLKATHAEGAQIVERRAAQLVPRRSGLLSSSLRSSGQASGGVVRAGRARVPYAGPIHFGWPGHGISPQPFLYDALDDRAAEVLGVYRRRVDSLIDKHGLD